MCLPLDLIFNWESEEPRKRIIVECSCNFAFHSLELELSTKSSEIDYSE